MCRKRRWWVDISYLCITVENFTTIPVYLVCYASWFWYRPVLRVGNVYSEIDFFALQIERLIRYDFDFDWARTIIGLTHVKQT